jgi:hypothetical protein
VIDRRDQAGTNPHQQRLLFRSIFVPTGKETPPDGLRGLRSSHATNESRRHHWKYSGLNFQHHDSQSRFTKRTAGELSAYGQSPLTHSLLLSGNSTTGCNTNAIDANTRLSLRKWSAIEQLADGQIDHGRPVS